MRTLEGALLSGRVGHAYLFCGPRGTGKTTIARLFAKALNCQKLEVGGQKLEIAQAEPCNKCDSCVAVNEGRSLDLIEIDAASHTSVDNVRELNDSARVAASSSNRKIFVIDEVHMLSKSAFNALLKTLEEPPAHVIFILATTELHKLPETILSRVQRFDFKKISGDLIISKLKKIAEAEDVDLENEVLTALADYASGSLRDAESALAKLMAFSAPVGVITAEAAFEILGLVPSRVHETFFSAIVAKDTTKALAQIAQLHENGVDFDNFTKQFLHFIRAKLITLASAGQSVLADVQPDAEKLISIINIFMKARSELKNSPVPQLPLELAVMELTKPS